MTPQAAVHDSTWDSEKDTNVRAGLLSKLVQQNKNKILEQGAKNQSDSIVLHHSQKNNLFTVPFQTRINRDSLRLEQKKITLPYDTLPKDWGLHSYSTVHVNDSMKLPNYIPGIFNNHLLTPNGLTVKTKAVSQQNWMAGLFIGIIFLIALLRVFYQRKFSLFLSAFFSKRFSHQIVREENALTQTTSLIMTIVFMVSLSLFLFYTVLYYKLPVLNLISWQGYLLTLAACIAFYSIKTIVHRAGGLILNIRKEIEEYIFNQFLVIQVIGLILAPICILYSYSTLIPKEYLIFAGFTTLLASFIIRLSKSKNIANVNSFSPMYIFLYLCTFEILPLIIIIKLIV